MKLELVYLIMTGLLIGFNIALSIYFVMTGNRTKPYKYMFALLCFVFAVQDMIDIYEPILAMRFPERDLGLVMIVKDLIAIPICVAEIESLVRQDLDRFPWSERFTRIFYNEIPYFMLLLLAFLSQAQIIVILIYWFTIAHLLACAYSLHGMLIAYESQMRKLYGENTPYSIKWIYYLMGLMLAFAVLYMGFTNSDTKVNMLYTCIYSPCVIIVMSVHAYFIEKQRIPHRLFIQATSRSRKEIDSRGF